MRRRCWSWLSVFAMLSALCSAPLLAQTVASTEPANKPSGKPLTLALNWKAEPQFGGFYAAQVQGHYAANGLNVNIVEGGSGTPTIQMLLAGKVDYAIVSADEAVIALGRGASDIVALFATYQTNPQGIMTHAARGFASLEQVMRGDGVLLWQSGLPYAQYLRKKYAPLTVVTAPYLGGIGNFQNDPKVSQQCFVTSEPLTAAAAGVKVKTFLVADSGYNPYTSVMVTRRQRLDIAPDEVKAMVAAVRGGWNDYLADPTATNAAMQALNKAMSAETFAASAQAQRELIKTGSTAQVGEMSLARWQTLADQLLEIKVIQKPVAVDGLFVNL
ncbi:MAG: ABC transporter substrate-binding protein [Haliea sp.]|nr:ABC transporter substrate-binding protein [Haliea sp.]